MFPPEYFKTALIYDFLCSATIVGEKKNSYHLKRKERDGLIWSQSD